MQAIITKYLGPTNTKGERIKASCEAGSVTISYRHDLDQLQAHAAAAKALCLKLAKEYDERYEGKPGYDSARHNCWARPFVTGGTDKGYVHVFVNSPQTDIL